MIRPPFVPVLSLNELDVFWIGHSIFGRFYGFSCFLSPSLASLPPRVPPPERRAERPRRRSRAARPSQRTNRGSGAAAYAGCVMSRGAFRSRENVQQLVDIGLIVVDGWRDAHEMLINLYVNLRLFQLSGDPLRVCYNKADN